jgi:hypothetical protein
LGRIWDCHFKFQNQSWDDKLTRRKLEILCLALSDHMGLPIYVHYYFKNDVCILKT